MRTTSLMVAGVALCLALAGCVAVESTTAIPEMQTARAEAAEKAPDAGQIDSPKEGWDFWFDDFVIGAWWGPGSTEHEMQAYRDAGFNITMIGRYMQIDDYGDPVEARRELDLAKKHGLAVMFDTYTMNEKPWGGVDVEITEHPMHHAATLPELKWLVQNFGNHPALAGFMIGDDKSALSERLIACTDYLRENAPHLMPWICQNAGNPGSLAEHGNPIYDVQIYPTLYAYGKPADALARDYCESYAVMRRESQARDLYMWPMLNTCRPGTRDDEGFGHLQSASLVRFPAYAALAYGSDGIWYFTYGGGAIQKAEEFEDAEDLARNGLTPLYPIVQHANKRIETWGPWMVGRWSSGLFGNVFGPDDWPFDERAAGEITAEALGQVGEGKLVESMSDDLIVGILTKPGRLPLAMIVDCRVEKDTLTEPRPRRATVRFHPDVTRVTILEGADSRQVDGCEIEIELEGGGGQLVELQGPGIRSLCETKAIYAPVAQDVQTLGRPLKKSDLENVRRALLRIDVLGCNAEDPYGEKYIHLNGKRLARVPANQRDVWDLKTVELDAAAIAGLGLENEVSVEKGQDAWKMRNLTLAVQIEDGSWVRSSAMETPYASKGWALFREGEDKPFAEEDVTGPFTLTFE